MNNDNDLRAQIKKVQEEQDSNLPQSDSFSLFPKYELPLKFKILREFALNLIGGGIIAYILIMLFSKTGFIDTGETILIASCVLIAAFLAASYRSYRIWKGMDPDGE